METKKKDNAINILLVDDQEINNFIHTKLLRKALLGLNFEIFVDLNGEQAMNHLYYFINHNRPAFPDYIFLDINMPVMNGWEFLDEYTKLKLGLVKNSKVFVTSSSLFKGDIDKSYTYECVKDYITKPLTLERLQTIMYD